MKAAQAGRQGPGKRRLAEQFAAGEIITDMSKKEWKLGLPIGQGGFGCIYLGKCVTASNELSVQRFRYFCIKIISQL